MSYKNMEIYKLAKELSIQVHGLTLLLPKIEQYEIGSQIRRSSKSVRANIVEGYGRRRYKKEFVRFLTYALASSDETVDHLECLYQTNSIKNLEDYKILIDQYQTLGKMLIRFIAAVDKNHNS